jgi:hypothetical protein
MEKRLRIEPRSSRADNIRGVKRMVDARDTFEMEGSIGTTKADLTNNTVPANKFVRKVYSWLLCNNSSDVSGITFTIEKGSTVVRTLPEIVIGAYDTINEQSVLGLITIPAGHTLKAQVTTGDGPVAVILRAFDL